MMRKAYRFAVLLGAGLGMVPWMAIAQAPAQTAVQPSAVPVAPMVLPADQQATREQLIKLFEAGRTRQTMETAYKRAAELSKQYSEKTVDDTIAKTPILSQMTPDEKNKYKELMYKFTEKNSSVIQIDEFLEDYVDVNQRYLSRSDVDAMLEFFNSTAGQHMLNQQPAILQELGEKSMKRTGTRIKDISDQQNKDIQELISAAQAEQSSNQAVSKHTSFIDRLGTLVNLLSNAYTPGQDFAKTLQKVAESSANQQQ